jgi:hypothetical protein
MQRLWKLALTAVLFFTARVGGFVQLRVAVAVFANWRGLPA